MVDLLNTQKCSVCQEVKRLSAFIPYKDGRSEHCRACKAAGFVNTKTCSVCGETKTLSEFASGSRGKLSYCRSCKAEYDRTRAPMPGVVQGNSELFDLGLVRCSSCRETKSLDQFHLNAKKKTGRTNNCKPCNLKMMRRTRVARYGLTLEQFDAMVADQNGSCAICLDPFGEGNAPVIDHDHSCCSEKAGSCGKCVRGLLCQRCNMGIGALRDNPDSLIRAFDYLLRTPVG